MPLERVVPLGPWSTSHPQRDLKVVGCTQLTCTFDASASSDPEGGSLSYTWDFGDATEGDGATVTHEYAQAGTYDVVVEVRDPDGAASTASTTINVSPTPPAPLAFRDVAGANTNSTAISPRVPTTVQPNDALLLYVTANRSDVTLQAPSGWQSLGRQVDESMQSQLWLRVAQSTDAGATVRVTSSATAKMTAHVMAYSGTSTLAPVSAAVAASESRKTAAHTTPVVTTSPSSWVVSLWSNKSSSTTSWSCSPVRHRSAVPVDVQQWTHHVARRRLSRPIGVTSAGGLTATASQSGTMATMWTVVLTPP